MLRGKRIILIVKYLDLGGTEQQALLLARYLRREHGCDVEMWAFRGPGRVSDLCERYGIPWRIEQLAWSGNRLVRSKRLMRFAWRLRRARPDVILAYTMFPNVICGLVRPWTGARLFIWNQRDEGLSRMGQRTERLAVRQTEWFVSNSKHAADFLVRGLGVKPGRVRVIRNGVELAVPQADRKTWRKRLGISDDCLVACMIANLHTFKDHSTLLEAWRLVVNRSDEIGLEVLLLLAGRFDNTHDNLKALAFDLELGRTVRFLGEVNDIAGLVGAVDLGVFSSRFEGCPNGVLECMASGLAIAGTDIPGIREAVGPDAYDYLAPPGDVGALADRVLTLAVNPEIRKRLGERNRRRIEREFSSHAMCEQTAALIVEGLEGSRAWQVGERGIDRLFGIGNSETRTDHEWICRK